MLPPTKNDKFREENAIMPYTCRRPFFLEEELLFCKDNTMKDTIRTDNTQQLEAEQRHVNRHEKSHNP